MSRGGELTTFSPEAAGEIIRERNTANFRKPSRRGINILKAAMLSGKFEGDNGQTVSFDEDGVLLDGQKRFMACHESGVPLTVRVVYGLPRRVAGTIDIGQKRTAGNYLSHLGHQNVNALAAACRWCHAWRTGEFKKASPTIPHMTPDECEAILEGDPLLTEGVKVIVNHYPLPKMIRPGIGGFLAYALLCQGDAKEVDRFFHCLQVGAGYGEGTALHRLRSRLTFESLSNRQKTYRIPDLELAALVVKAWNINRKTPHREFRVLAWKESVEAFPDLPILPAISSAE